MAIYIILIAYILALSVFLSRFVADEKKSERIILQLGMFAIFLLLALKKETVGIDIVGYKEQYILSAAVPWANTSYVYFEPGYIQLMKFFSKLGLDFQFFAAVIYAVCCSAYYRFIKRYSRNTALSLLIFICYQFLVFYTSGLRQALAMAICIYAYLLLDSKWGKGWQRYAASVLMVILAATVHRSALLFLVVLMLHGWCSQKVHWVLMTLGLAVSVAVRSQVFWIIKSLLGEIRVSGGITLGGNMIFLMGLTLFCVVAYYQRRNKDPEPFQTVSTNVLMMAVIAQIVFSGSTLLRSAMYLTMFLIPGLPCALKCYERRIEYLLTWFLGLFLIVLFWTDTLSINQLNLCPYRFFWQ